MINLLKCCKDMLKNSCEDTLYFFKTIDLKNSDIEVKKDKEINPIKDYLRNNQKRIDIYKKR